MAIKKIDSNITGLSYAEEVTLGELDDQVSWFGLEPNSYSDFGAQISTVAREPIDPSRQLKKGTITDIDASGGFNQDLTFSNMTRLMQGLFFADAHEYATSDPITLPKKISNNITSIDSVGLVTVNTMYGYYPRVDDLFLFEGFSNQANNGIKRLIATDVELQFSDLVEEAVVPSNATIRCIGHQYAEEITLSANGYLARLTSVPYSFVNVKAGDWIFVGGDKPENKFPISNGYGRVANVAPDYSYIELDKTTFDMTGIGVQTSSNVHIYLSTTIKNEKNYEKIKRRTYHIERTLGENENGRMAEYLIGATPNEFTLNMSQADKVTFDISFVATDNQQANSLMFGERVQLVAEEAYNTSSDLFIRLANASDAELNLPLFGYSMEGSLVINNNVTPNKAIGIVGAFDTTAGNFQVTGSTNSYFSSLEAVASVRNNADATIDIRLAKKNKAIIFDIPLLGLGDARLNVEKDNAIMLPLEINAAESKFGHSLLFASFAYLPNLAM